MVNQKLGYFITLIFISIVATFYQIQLSRLQERLDNLVNAQRYIPRPSEVERGVDFTDEEDVLVLYNRVPKTGSTSFVGIAYELCKRNAYHVLHVNITANSHILSLNNQISFVNNVTNWKSMKPALYHGHFAFIDFSKFGFPKPLYINIIRRPLDRFISYYYFVRYGDNFRPYLIRRKHGDTITFDECVERDLPDCDPNLMWLQVPFFCGHASNCWKPGNKWALTEAKKNLVNNYFLVGVTEELEDFIGVLEQSLPRLFKGATNHYLNSNKSHLRQTVQKDSPSDETVKKIKQSAIWQMENEFYDFAVDHFHFAKKNTLKNKLQKVMYEKIRPKSPA
ncbi:heparin sulfate O-sulfotransferase [Cylas formicarius]|uniref:heparin sulfate O-sulfotransferase n=1 Tax=Cylas formicarius TaxID=197179 RepID=UPI0029587BC5|nr:heparin sulfate O-sulfotransferase [Cylas formicarius]